MDYKEVSYINLERLAKVVKALSGYPSTEELEHAVAACQSLDDLGPALNKVMYDVLDVLDKKIKARKAGGRTF